MNQKINYKENAKKSIVGAANLLIRKANEIVSDLDTEKVTEIYISMRIGYDEDPAIDISKSYIAG